ncbi:MAG: hypothetical protein JRJ06_08075 [Deltaproteobacteria bacterium]|nr:hypothetical protein [Deltaproteobacteria bacterium]
MRIALYIISILWIVLGTFLIIYTENTRELLKKTLFTDRIRLLAILPTVFGIVLVAGAFYYKEMFWLTFILGLLGIIKGVYGFIGPQAQIKGLLDWWFHKAGDGTIRLYGLISFTLGIAILSYL